MVSCVRDVEIDLEDLPDRIVLNASVCPGKEVCAHLSKTWFIMDSVPDFELSDAKVRVYVNDEFQGLMRNDDLPEDSAYETVAGFMMYMLRKIPKRTDKVVYADYTFEVMDVDNNKIDQVLITRNIKKPDDPVKPVPPEA